MLQRVLWDLNSKKIKWHILNVSYFSKNISSSVSETLSTLYNKSFSQQIFPDHMKHATVTPLHKGGSKLDMTNYRPISVLPICSKILEKLMLTSLLDFLDKKTLLTNTNLASKKTNQPLQQYLTLPKTCRCIW